MKIYLISDNIDTYTGMRLVGIEGCVVHEKQEFIDSLNKALSDKNIGIILINEKFAREYSNLINDVKLNRKVPLIVEIPDRHGSGLRPDFITAYINEAIGLKL